MFKASETVSRVPAEDLSNDYFEGIPRKERTALLSCSGDGLTAKYNWFKDGKAVKTAKNKVKILWRVFVICFREIRPSLK